MANRHSTYSTASAMMGGRSAAQQSGQVSTTTLLNALHVAYTQGQPYSLDAGTSILVNTWLTASESGRGEATTDAELARRAWEHARRRAEDGCIVLGSLHESAPSVLGPTISALPMSIPSSLDAALSVLRPFTCHVTPQNASFARHSALAAKFTLTLAGELTGVSLSLSTSGIDTSAGLLKIPGEAGYRAFDVFYFLLTSASTPAEREFLSLKTASAYSLLNKSGTYSQPSYLPAADDTAAAEGFRQSLKTIGIKGAALRNLLSVLAALLKLGDTLGLLIDAEDLDDVCEEVGSLLGLDPEFLSRKCSTDEREALVSGLYESLVDWIIMKANQAMNAEIRGLEEDRSSSGSAYAGAGIHTPNTNEDAGDTVSITVIEIPRQNLGKAVVLRGIFDDSQGINAEIKDDGLEVATAGSSVLKEMANAVAEVAVDLDPSDRTMSSEREREQDRRQGVLEKVDAEVETGGFLKTILCPVAGEGISIGKFGRLNLSATLGSSRVWYLLSIHPTDESPQKLASLASTTSAWSAGAVSRQLRAWRLPEWSNRRNKNLDFTADFDIDEFATRYAHLGCQEGRDGVESWVIERGWSNGDVVVGHERVWIREGAWWEAETMLDVKSGSIPAYNDQSFGMGGAIGSGMNTGYSAATPYSGSGFFPPMHPDGANPFASNDNLVQEQLGASDVKKSGARSIAPTVARTVNTMGGGDYGLGGKGDQRKDYDPDYETMLDAEMGDSKHVETEPTTASRRLWVALVWALTFWIPSFALRYVGRMKRPDVRMAWREKFVLVLLIFFVNALVVFYIVAFGRLLCPNFDKAWTSAEVSQHQGDDDFYVSINGGVYDITKFWKIPHGDPLNPTTRATMGLFVGRSLDEYFPFPLTLGCPSFVTSPTVQLVANTSAYDNYNGNALHDSGPNALYRSTGLGNVDWYTTKFKPTMKEYYKGPLVWDKANITSDGQKLDHPWFILNGKVYDLSTYYFSVEGPNRLTPFLPADVSALIRSNMGQDISSSWKKTDNFTKSLECLDNVFYVGIPDFRKSAQCQFNNYILLAFTVILCLVIVVKFLAALRFGSKKNPAPQDKFVICQVPAYTEGEDQLRKGLDSLTALQYDNKRKLLCVICDGMIVGGGNDRPTPKIVLDILGVDPKTDPPALPFKSIGQSSEKLNYGKVYSGLYEFEGNVVPYIVVVKVGKESEQTKSKPGNRGKRDSQILLMSFLNRVHYRAPMNPLELEMFHQINNIIGVDPELYEYLLMVDADTMVREDALNRLVASCANDAKIIGICGETNLENEGQSWWTMIQVYEYFISHHLSKAFESLFGSVTCLPGCFSMYRLRTADKGRPLIIADKIIEEYSDCNVDTLHKKNLLSLGEDRYLTTLMTKHFPTMSYKFIPDAYAATAAPETWSVLLSQRRRWINSTIHNLAELVWLKDLCGFCCFSMRFVVFVDLFGTIILPATCAYIVYLIYNVVTHSGQFPIISIIMLAAVYGLQALIFILKRQWQHVGWMIIYVLAFPVYSFVLPIYSFWKQDDFSWGTTRIVIGEKGDKQIVAIEDEGFNPRSVPLQKWDDYASVNNLPGRRGQSGGMEKSYVDNPYTDNAYEMDDIRSTYSSVKPASTILTGFHGLAPAYAPPRSPAPMGQLGSHSRMSSFTRYTDQPQFGQGRRSPGNAMMEPYRDNVSDPRLSRALSSTDNLNRAQTPNPRQARSPLAHSRRTSALDLRANQGLPDDMAITEAIRSCLAEVDLDNVTKKQVRGLVEQRLQTALVGERRTFLDQQIDAELANMYTASFAFFEALWEAGVTACFVNLGSDHPSIIEAMVKGQQEGKGQFPRIYTCPNEMVALSMADGYARLTGKPQCVIIHVDVGTQGLGAAVHNASCGRAPVLIFAGLSPYTQDGEVRGSRTEYIHWVQDVPDQKQIVAQYCRYTGEIKSARNVKQIVRRALQFATSDPKGPVYLYGAREVMEEELEPYKLNDKHWDGIGTAALPEDAVKEISEALGQAKEPLVICGYSGRKHASVGALVKLADTVKGLRVLDTAGSDMCFPADHRAWLGLRFGVDRAIETADVIIVLDCDVPWIPAHNRPRDDARVFHIDVDPLKQQMPVFYIAAEGRWKADACTAITQLNGYIASSEALSRTLSTYEDRWSALAEKHSAQLAALAEQARPKPDGSFDAASLAAAVRVAVPDDTIFVIEAVTSTVLVADQIRATRPGSWLNCGGGGLGWSGGAALGIKLGSEALEGKGKGKFICQIVGDGTFLFSVPGSVYWIAARYGIPVLTVVLNNKGWNAPRRSLELVHPHGMGSKASNEDIHISLAPTPDYAGIARAAAGGQLWAGRTGSFEELQKMLPEAVRAVQGGRCAVLDAHLGGSDGKFGGYKEESAKGYGTGKEGASGTTGLG